MVRDLPQLINQFKELLELNPLQGPADTTPHGNSNIPMKETMARVIDRRAICFSRLLIQDLIDTLEQVK